MRRDSWAARRVRAGEKEAVDPSFCVPAQEMPDNVFARGVLLHRHMSHTATGPLVMENGRRSLARYLEPLRALPGVQLDELGPFTIGAHSYSLPRFTFRGPNSSDPIRIGVFATIHGDEPAGALAIASFLAALSSSPD